MDLFDIVRLPYLHMCSFCSLVWSAGDQNMENPQLILHLFGRACWNSSLGVKRSSTKLMGHYGVKGLVFDYGISE